MDPTAKLMIARSTMHPSRVFLRLFIGTSLRPAKPARSKRREACGSHCSSQPYWAMGAWGQEVGGSDFSLSASALEWGKRPKNLPWESSCQRKVLSVTHDARRCDERRLPTHSRLADECEQGYRPNLFRCQTAHLVSAAELSGFHGVAHQHGDGQRPHAAGDGRHGSGDFGDFGMNVAHQG